MTTRSRRLCVAALAAGALVGCTPAATSAGRTTTAPATIGPTTAEQDTGLEQDVTDGQPRTIAYDDHPDTVLDVHAPTGEATGTTVVLLHGGFWRERYRRDLMDPLVPSLTAAGHTVVNLEYRRVGGDGAWPTLLADVAAGIDALATVEGVDTDRVVTVGHSAGGHLAVWAAGRHRIAAGQVGAAPVVRPCAAVSQAGVVVFDLALEAGLGGGAVDDLLDGASDDRLAVADPARLLPLGVPVTLVHGEQDDIVPLAQSQAWVQRASDAGDETTLVALDGDHFDAIDPTHPLWAAVVDVVDGAC